MRLDYNYKIKPLMENIDQSGDLVFFEETENYFYFGVIDALGHGKEANRAAKTALDFLQKLHNSNPADDIRKMHLLLAGTRGIVIGLCFIDKNKNEITYSGVGNITARIIGNQLTKLVFRDGVIGYSIPTIRNQFLKIQSGDIALFYSDGIREHFDLLDHPNLINESAKEISSTLMDIYAKENDDSSIITVKVL